MEDVLQDRLACWRSSVSFGHDCKRINMCMTFVPLLADRAGVLQEWNDGCLVHFCPVGYTVLLSSFTSDSGCLHDDYSRVPSRAPPGRRLECNH